MECKKEPPFKYIEPTWWQVPLLVLVQALVAFGANIAGWAIDPVTFFFIPLFLAILMWKQRSATIISNYLGFNTKNIAQKILASIAGASAGVSLYLILKSIAGMSLIPYASLEFSKYVILQAASFATNIFYYMVIPLSILVLIVLLSFFASGFKYQGNIVWIALITLAIPFFLLMQQPSNVLYVIVGFGEEILCLIFAMIMINYLVCKYGMSYKDLKTHFIAWLLARGFWSVIHALSGYGFVLSAYISAMILGMIFTFIGYMFWYDEIGSAILAFLGIADFILYMNTGQLILFLLSLINLSIAGAIVTFGHILRDESLAFREYVIYGAAMAHAFYDLAFLYL